MLIKRLSWDSKFFGFNVGRYLKETFVGSDEDEFCAEYNDGKFDCVYIFSDPCDDAVKAVADRNNFYFIDTRLVYTLSRKCWVDNGQIVRMPQILDTTHTQNVASVRQIAESLSQSSRFWFDPRLRRKVPDLYKLWLDQVIREKTVVVVASRVTNDIGAFVGCSLNEGVGDLELIATDKRLWGRGFGMLVVQDAVTFLFGRGAKEVIVKTQASNKAACGLYQKAGFTLKDSKTIYHVWRRK